LHYRPDFHPDLAYLCKRLRCHLGGDRPSQTTHQALSPNWIRRKKYEVRIKKNMQKFFFRKIFGLSLSSLFFLLNSSGLAFKLTKSGITLLAPSRPKSRLQSLPPILGIINSNAMPSYSKAPRGLFVLLQVDGIFTVIAISPSSSLRQLPSRYAFNAGQNLPDKEFRSFLLTLDRSRERTIFFRLISEFGI